MTTANDYRFPHVSSMSAIDIHHEITRCVEYLAYLRHTLLEQCKIEGHTWDNPKGTPERVAMRDQWVEDDLQRGGGYYIRGEIITYFKRTCTICGHSENKSGSPQPPISPYS